MEVSVWVCGRNKIEGLGVVAIGGISGYFAAVFQAQQRNGPAERQAQYEFKKMLNDTQVVQHNLVMAESLKATYSLKQSMQDWRNSAASKPKAPLVQSDVVQADSERSNSSGDQTFSVSRLSRTEQSQVIQAYQATDTSQDSESFSSISAYL